MQMSHRLISRFNVKTFCSYISSFTWRTHTCGELNLNHLDQEVTLCGWTTFHRCEKFLIMRDTQGLIQVLFKENEKKFLNTLPIESVIQVKGIVKKRPNKDINKKMPTGEIEVDASDIKLLNPSIPKLPISMKDQENATEVIKYKYRYLSLRNVNIQENLRIRSRVLMKVREFLHNIHGFTDIETPTLFKRTPGGAKEFLVPTKFPGKFYSLTQSPQQFKQLLMVAGMDRYFQIARCYRNEGTKPDRQPEFTQVDIELSFTTAEQIRQLVEQLLEYSWPPEKSAISTPFPTMTYAEAIRDYGSDKPDIRYEMKLQNVTEELKDCGLHITAQALTNPNFIISCIVIPRGSKLIKNSLLKELKKLAESLSTSFVPISVKENFSWNSSISKHISEELQKSVSHKLLSCPDDLIILSSGKYDSTCAFLGKARVMCADHLQYMKNDQFCFLWVTDFPMFLLDEKGILESAHHPFTAPAYEDVDLIYSNPIQAKSLHYDLVLNGQEVGGGSIRIHDSNLQQYIIEKVLKEDVSHLQHLLDALRSGCPPHGGIALGVDRLMAIICGCRSITSVMAFPKSLDGKDLMSGAPCHVTSEEERLYHIKSIVPEH